MGTPDAQSVARTEARVADLRRECEAFLITEQRAHSDTLTDSATVKWHAMQRDLRQLETKAATKRIRTLRLAAPQSAIRYR